MEWGTLLIHNFPFEWIETNSFFKPKIPILRNQTHISSSKVPMTMTASASRDLQNVHPLRDAQRRPQNVLLTLSE